MTSLILKTGPSFWDYISAVFSTIPKVAYMLWASLASVIDVLQLFFRKIAGLDVYYIDGKAQSGDIVSHFLDGIFGFNGADYPTLRITFWSIVILGFILVILATITAIIRSEYSPDKDKGGSKMKFVGAAIKAVANFAIIPITCIFGIWMSNVVLQAVDSATSEGASMVGMTTEELGKLEPWDSEKGWYNAYDLFGHGTACKQVTFSGQAFKVAAYNANRVRSGYYAADGKGFSTYGIFNSKTSDKEEVALKIDNAFANFYKLKTPQRLNISGSANAFCLTAGVDIFSISYAFEKEAFSKFDAAMVWYYYNLWSFDLIVGFAVLMIMATLLSNIVFGIAKRLFELVGLFLISPGVAALGPLDGGKGLDKWKTSFISKTLMAYGAVIGMNILFLILPLLYNIQFFNIIIVDNLINTILIITGLISVKSFIALVSGFVGGEDANAIGEGISREVGSTLAKSAGMAVGALGVGAKTLAFTNPALFAAKKGAKKGIKEASKAASNKWGKGKYKKAASKAGDDQDSAKADFDKVNKVKTDADTAYQSARQDAKNEGKSDADADAAGKTARRGSLQTAGYTGTDEAMNRALSDNLNSHQDKVDKANVTKERADYVASIQGRKNRKEAETWAADSANAGRDITSAGLKTETKTHARTLKFAKGFANYTELEGIANSGLGVLKDAKGMLSGGGFSSGFSGEGGLMKLKNKLMTAVTGKDYVKKKEMEEAVKESKKKIDSETAAKEEIDRKNAARRRP